MDAPQVLCELGVEICDPCPNREGSLSARSVFHSEPCLLDGIFVWVHRARNGPRPSSVICGPSSG